MFHRNSALQKLEQLFGVFANVAILGPRQCGKTTLARTFGAAWSKRADKKDRGVHYFDCEDPSDLARLEFPKLSLEPLKGLVIIDEVQRRPELFPFLRVLADRPKPAAQFLILGSASRELIGQSSESLAGRIDYLELTPFSLPEVGRADQLWVRGGFPRAFLANNDEESYVWRQAYIRAFLEQDIPAMGIDLPPAVLRRFWMMLAHNHGQIFNASEIGKSLSVSDHTARRYLDLLEGTLMTRTLTPWFENIKKRQVKRPKIYLRDAGILHGLLGIKNAHALVGHPKLGSSWEGFALEEIVRHHGALREEVFFWATHNGAELDLLIIKDGQRLGYEFKYTDAPRVTPSMHAALEDLSLDQLLVVIPGDKAFPLGERIAVRGLEAAVMPG